MSSISFLVVAVVVAAEPQPAELSVEQLKATIQRSIPYIEERGLWWIEKKKCASCHRVGNMVWSLSAARNKGLKVSKQVGEWVDWSLRKETSPDDKGKIAGKANREGLAQFLLARRLFEANDDRTKLLEKLPAIVASGQRKDGSWKPAGQLPKQKRSSAETADVTTIWLTLALLDHDPARHRAQINKARQRIEARTAGKSTEWFAVRLLLAQQTGDKATREKMIEAILKRQQEDGGWGWLVDEESDALGTGLALYALVRAGGDKEAIGRAQRFLVANQKENGSWAVKGTKANKRKRTEETATYWGTTWAVIALSECLPSPSAR